MNISNKRIGTGIFGLDRFTQGGFLEGTSTLISGATGTGKTIFCCQFIWHGVKNGEKCFYLTLAETVEEIVADAAGFGWDFRKYIKKGLLAVTFFDPTEPTSTIDEVKKIVKDAIKKGIKRIVVDSTSTLGTFIITDHQEFRKELQKLMRILKKNAVTTLITAEIPDETSGLASRFGVEEFLSDNVILLKGVGIPGELTRRLLIKKFRRTNIDESVLPFKFTSRGIVVYKPPRITL